MSKKITLLIDGNNTLHRTHWIANNTGTQLINSKGENVGSRYTFLKTIKSYVDQFNADDIYVAWDKKLIPGENFRHSLVLDYKGGRNEERNKDVYADVDSVIQLITTLGIKSIFPGKLEADDVISWLCKHIEGRKIIVSVDRDFVQLIAEDISYFNPVKKQLVDVLNFEEVYGLKPKEFLTYKAIIGDKSDNIPGLEGYGEVKGIKLAKAYTSGVLSEKDKAVIAANQEIIDNNLKMMDLSYGLTQYPEEVVLYQEQYNKTKEMNPDFALFKQYCTDLEFNSILGKFDSWQATFNKKSTANILAEYFKSFE